MRFQRPELTSARRFEGQVLAASPKMDDPRFHRSVILVLHQSEEGAVGVVLNRPIAAPIEHKELKSILKLGPKFFQGGPVGGSLIALQLAQNKSEDQGVTGSVYMVQKPDELKAMKSNVKGSLRLFLGHAGWSAGQLEEEIADGWWYPLNALPQLLLLDGQDMWVEAIRRVGRDFYRDVLGIDRLPADSQLN